MYMPAEKKLRRINVALLVAIVLVNGYIITAPVAPSVWYWWQSRSGTQTKALQQTIERPVTVPNRPNSLVIPKMMLDTPLVEGPKSDSFALLNQGAWRLPYGSSPDKGSNTVIAGHRFSYTGPHGIFYYLDKLAPGDDIGVWWNNQLYRYNVTETKVVSAHEVAVQEPTSDARLTLYTCTPLWNPVKRLVVVATPTKKPQTPPAQPAQPELIPFEQQQAQKEVQLQS